MDSFQGVLYLEPGGSKANVAKGLCSRGCPNTHPGRRAGAGPQSAMLLLLPAKIKGSSTLPAQLRGEGGAAGVASEQGSSHDKSVPDLTDSAFQGWTRLVLAPCTKCPLPSPLPRTLSTCSHSSQAPGPPLL